MLSSISLSISLKRRFLVLLGLATGAVMSGGVQAQEPNADLILSEVRYSQAVQDMPKLTGRLRNDLPDDGKKLPFELNMANGRIRFDFSGPAEVIELELAEKGAKLNHAINGKSVPVGEAEYGTAVRGTSVNFEDLSLRFLYWPNATILHSQTISSMDCWVIRVVNPDRRGPYHTVDVWVDKASRAIAKMEAHDRTAKKVKSFRVSKGQRYKKSWILKQMLVESHDPATGKVNGRTYMDINDPGK